MSITITLGYACIQRIRYRRVDKQTLTTCILNTHKTNYCLHLSGSETVISGAYS